MNLLKLLFHFLLPLILTFSIPLKLHSEQTLRNKIGEMLVVGFQEDALLPNPEIADLIQKYHVGGVILFAGPGLGSSNVIQDNIKNPSQLKSLTKSLQDHASLYRLNHEGPLFIAIDQEGGWVSRLKNERGFTHQNLSAKVLGQINDIDYTFNYAKSLSAYLNDLGINLNFAPVVDLAVNPNNFIFKRDRCFSDDPKLVQLHADAFIRGMHQNSIITTLKHFPGHGSSLADTHYGIADISKTWFNTELEPYEKFINCGYSDMVMISHVINQKLDPDSSAKNILGELYPVPATFSKKIVSDLLRNQLGFKGVIITDDLCMGAIADQYSFEDALKLSIKAGVNMIILANHEYDQTAEAVQIIEKLVNSGEISLQTIDDSYQRILELKKNLSRCPK